MEFEPRLAWDGPDDEGEYCVTLIGLKDWKLAAYGLTPKDALARLAEMITAAHTGKGPDAIWMNRLGEQQKQDW